MTKPKVRFSQKLITYLSSEEISKAEMLIFSYLQHKYYKEEMDDLSKGKLVQNSSSLIKLSPFIKNGLMYVGGRLKLAASLPFLQKHQIILPHSNHATNLIIRDIHIKLGHASRQHVLAEKNSGSSGQMQTFGKFLIHALYVASVLIFYVHNKWQIYPHED